MPTNTRINGRTKGATGEREVCKALNAIVSQLMSNLGYSESECEKAKTSIQRNQNQSAVGGADLSNTWGMSIEIKRQEKLCLPAWWKQCSEQALKNGERPVLIYRQNRTQWRVRLAVWLKDADSREMGVQGEISYNDFLIFFREWVRVKLLKGEQVRL